MSSYAVRTAINAELGAFALVEGIAHYPTINQVPSRPTDPLWITADFTADYTEKRCYQGTKRAELGTIDVIVNGKAGLGSDAVLQLADKLETRLLAYYGTNVEITGSIPANDLNDGDAQHYYSVEVSFYYTHEIE